jgi:hypothetical protein
VTFADLNWTREDVIHVDIPHNGTWVFQKTPTIDRNRSTSLYMSPIAATGEVMYYFEQHACLSFPEGASSVLLCPMFYVPPRVARADPNIYKATHVSFVGSAEWILMCAIWTSRCGKTHILTLSSDLVMTLTEITNNNPFRDLVALPQIYVDLPEVVNIVRLFMSHQGNLLIHVITFNTFHKWYVSCC